MNVFVLCTGRCGSTTFARACRHATNYTVGNESRRGEAGTDNRLAYPENHIEVDGRLAWFLGTLDRIYGDNAHYVHLTWTRESTAKLLAHRYATKHKRSGRSNKITMIKGFAHSIVYSKNLHQDVDKICRHFWDTVTDNIVLFLKDKSRVSRVSLDSAPDDFARFWTAIDAKGDLDAASKVFYEPAVKLPQPKKRALLGLIGPRRA